MSKTFFIVFKREYFNLIKNKAFWATTIVMPIFIVIVSIVSGVSSQSIDAKLKTDIENAKAIYILDEANLISPMFYTKTLIKTDNFEFGLQQVKTDNADAFIFYTKDIASNNIIKVYSRDKGLLSIGSFDEFSKNLIKQSILSTINDPTKIALYNSSFKVETKLFKAGQETSSGIEKLIIPIGSVVIYFFFTSISTAYLLMSISEEKENRMIEIILSSIKPTDLIMGKVIGQVLAVLTQMLVIILLIGFLLTKVNINLPIDLSQIQIDPAQLVLSIIYILFGFLILSITMVGVGAAMPTYREASSFSSIFIIMSIFPIYFFSLILVEPSGTIALITSYFPYTAPMILMLRNALGVLGPFEIVLSIITLSIFVVILSKISYKLFEFGSLEYNQKISFMGFIKTFRNSK